MPQVEEENDFIYQQSEASPHYHHLVRAYLNRYLPKVGLDEREQKNRRYLAGHQDHLTQGQAMLLWGYVKDSVLFTLRTAGSA